MLSEPRERTQPVLRWAGGKQRLVGHLLRLAPPTCERYFEPFVGAGSLFLASQYPRCIISDINHDLISMYRAIQERPDLVGRHLRTYAASDSREFYLGVRNRRRRSAFAEAARFIYLNRAGYSGIYRVNLDGLYNVPYGPGRTGLRIPSQPKLDALAETLRTRAISVTVQDFQEAISTVGPGDFVYLDPPYERQSATEFFDHYSTARGTDNAILQRALDDLTDRGAMVLLTIRSTDQSATLFSAYSSTFLDSAQWLSVKHRAGRLRTHVVTNYDPVTVGTVGRGRWSANQRVDKCQ